MTKNVSLKPNSVNQSTQQQLWRTIAIGIILVIVFFGLPVPVIGHDHHEHGHDHHHHHHHHINEPASFKWSRQANEPHDEQSEITGNHNHKPAAAPQSVSDLWLHALGSTLLISAAPYFLLYFIDLDSTEKMRPKLKVLLAFASGGLLGDAFLHLIPHAIHPHTHFDDEDPHHHAHESEEEEHTHHSHESDDITIGLYVLAGIITFLTVEKVVRLLKGGHGHSHGPIEPPKEKKTNANKNDKTSSVTAKTDEEKPKDIDVAGYLNLAADFTHNLTDGLAIGASYLAGNKIGIITTITILFHEVPHEIGDFAILIKSGCSKRKAMALQLVTAIGAVSGTVIALLGASDESAPWVLPFTAGGFIYIAAVSILPELLEESTKLLQSLKEIAALLLGVGIMVVIARFEH